MKILITGGGGYIGSYLLNNLPKKYHIICLDHGTRYKQLKKSTKNNVTFIKGDTSDAEMLEKILKKGIDIIIHLSGGAGNPICLKDPKKAVLTHILGTQILIQKSLKYEVERFIHVSTISVYSTFKKRKMPLTEKMNLMPDDFYGSVKMIAEKYVQENHPNHIILRLTNLYGKIKKFDNEKSEVIENFMNSGLKNSDITIYGDGKQKLDFIHIKDVCSCILSVIENPSIKNEIFNVGSGKLFSIEKIAKLILTSIKKQHKTESKIVKVPSPTGKIWPDRLMSINKIKKKLGWKPKISLNNGIELMLNSKD